MLQRVGFDDAAVEHDVFPKLSIRNRREEVVSGDRLRIMQEKGFIEESDEEELARIADERVAQLRAFIRESLSEEEKVLMGYSETEDDTILSAQKGIFMARKPIKSKTK